MLGSHVQQRGSLVDPDKTRFDFTQDAPMTPAQIAEVEVIVNAEVLANHATQSRVMAFDDAVKGCNIIVHVASPNTQNIVRLLYSLHSIFISIFLWML